MTIQEAIKSGKPFKRIPWEIWIGVAQFTKSKETVLNYKMHEHLQFTAKDILANDWEIKQ